MSDNPRSNLDELDEEAAKRSVFDFTRKNQILINLRLCECGIAMKLFPVLTVRVSLNNRFKNLFPSFSAVDITWAKQHSFTIPELIETEQRMKTHATEMAVLG